MSCPRLGLAAVTLAAATAGGCIDSREIETLRADAGTRSDLAADLVTVALHYESIDAAGREDVADPSIRLRHCRATWFEDRLRPRLHRLLGAERLRV
jgi:hypothetical protein